MLCISRCAILCRQSKLKRREENKNWQLIRNTAMLFFLSIMLISYSDCKCRLFAIVHTKRNQETDNQVAHSNRPGLYLRLCVTYMYRGIERDVRWVCSAQDVCVFIALVLMFVTRLVCMGRVIDSKRLRPNPHRTRDATPAQIGTFFL